MFKSIKHHSFWFFNILFLLSTKKLKKVIKLHLVLKKVKKKLKQTNTRTLDND